MTKFKIFLFGFIANLFFAQSVIASTLKSDVFSNQGMQTKKLADKAGFSMSSSVDTMIALVIQVFLGFLGIIFLILMIYAGYNWMTAGGNEEKVTKAKDTLTKAIIGLIIIVSAYAITYFVFNALGGSGGGGVDITQS